MRTCIDHRREHMHSVVFCFHQSSSRSVESARRSPCSSFRLLRSAMRTRHRPSKRALTLCRLRQDGTSGGLKPVVVGRGLEFVPIFAAIIAHAGGLACWLGRADAARRASTVLKGRSASVLFLARRPRWVPLYRFSRPLRLMRAVWHDGGVERTRRVGRSRRSRADRHRCYF